MASAEDVARVSSRPTDMAISEKQTLRPRGGSLVEEITGEEVVLIDLNTNSAYTLSGPGMEVWKSIQGGCSLEDTVKAVSDKYIGDPGDINAGVEDLIRQLLEEDLVQPSQSTQTIHGAGHGDPASDESIDAPKEPFHAPLLTKFEGLSGDLSMMKGFALRFG